MRRRTADMVTGKLDVRPAAAHLPAESAEPPPSPADEVPEEEAEEQTLSGNDE